MVLVVQFGPRFHGGRRGWVGKSVAGTRDCNLSILNIAGTSSQETFLLTPQLPDGNPGRSAPHTLLIDARSNSSAKRQSRFSSTHIAGTCGCIPCLRPVCIPLMSHQRIYPRGSCRPASQLYWAYDYPKRTRSDLLQAAEVFDMINTLT